MNCGQARQLFDSYLDGELSTSMATELDAHRLQCPDCRRTLALLEVSEHVLASDKDPISLREDFPDRLIACMERPRLRWTERIGRTLYIAGPIAAAALIALAFLGFFDGRRETEVAGHRAVSTRAVQSTSGASEASSVPQAAPHEELDPRLESWWGQVRTNLETKRESVESLQAAFDQTLLQPLNALEQASKPVPPREVIDPVDAETEAPLPEDDTPSTDDVEDL